MLYLRTLAESEALRAAFSPAAKVVIIGAGWIGLEAAAAARQAGSSVTIIEPQPTALYGAIGPEIGEKFADLHRAHGVVFRFGESSTAFRPAEVSGQLPAPGDSREGWPVGWVVTDSGAEIPADVVAVGIGAAPNDGLARAAGLEVDNGVLTDAALRTSDPDIFAAGDVANSYLPLVGHRVRLDHWANALHGGQAVAKSMLGQDVEYNRVPYFYSDQYDLGMECSGLPSPGSYDEVIYRGDSAALEFIACWLNGGRLVAGMNVNVWDVTDDIQALIRSGRRPRPRPPGRPRHPPSRRLNPTTPSKLNGPGPRTARGDEQPRNQRQARKAHRLLQQRPQDGVGVREVGQHRVRARGGQVGGRVRTGRHPHRPRPGHQRRLDVERRVADDHGRRAVEVRGGLPVHRGRPSSRHLDQLGAHLVVVAVRPDAEVEARPAGRARPA